MVEILEITHQETLSIRHEVMWPDKPIDYVHIPNDHQGKHFGLFFNGKMISVISLFIVNNEAQFRKFATLIDYQGQGFGSILIKEILNIVKRENVDKIWCNARVEKSNYYTKFGMRLTEHRFRKGGIEYVIMEKRYNTL
ncbi:GNAT family N-acetyltransferase [Algibacter sp. R77976]|uniref:GNAT family N-acetyltransferase n=1 Tax=Algibacter sp. R77976 TaxID=3093873 RepID=UPI0037CBA52E